MKFKAEIEIMPLKSLLDPQGKAVSDSILNKLSLVWGVKAYYYDGGTTTDQTIIQTKETLRKNKHIKKGDFVINLASTPASEKGMTNMVKLSKVER